MNSKKKKALLIGINSKYIHTNLALRDIYACSEGKVPQQLALMECTINQRLPIIIDEIYRQKADILLFSCYIWNIDFVNQIVDTYRKIAPNALIVVGGPEVSFHAKEYLQAHSAVDILIKGEGEATVPALLNALGETDLANPRTASTTAVLQKISGLLFRTKNKAEPTIYDSFAGTNSATDLLNPTNTAITSKKTCAPMEASAYCDIYETEDAAPFPMEDLPFPYPDLSAQTGKILYFESSRGCPFRCSYCLSSIAGKVRLMPLELALPYLQRFLDAKVPQVKFVDRTFNCNKAHALGIWKYLKEHDNGVTNFHFEVSAHLFDRETLDFLKTVRPEQFQLEVGVQSTNPDTIAQIQRTTNTEQLLSICQEIDSYQNIHQHLDLIAGLPFEDKASFARSFDTVYAIRPQQLQLGFLKILKGSQMEQEATIHEIVYNSVAPFEVLRTKWLNYDDILLLKGVEDMVERYYNSGQFRNTLELLLENIPSPYTFFEALGSYFFAKGYHLMSIPKDKAHTILKEFYERHYTPYTEQIREAAFFDICLKEKPKKLPIWIANERRYDHKEETIAFFHDPAQIETYLPQYTQEAPIKISRLAHLQGFTCDVTQNRAVASTTTPTPCTRQHGTNPLKHAAADTSTTAQASTFILFDYDHPDLLGNAKWWKISL